MIKNIFFKLWSNSYTFLILSLIVFVAGSSYAGYLFMLEPKTKEGRFYGSYGTMIHEYILTITVFFSYLLIFISMYYSRRIGKRLNPLVLCGVFGIEHFLYFSNWMGDWCAIFKYLGENCPIELSGIFRIFTPIIFIVLTLWYYFIPYNKKIDY